MLTWEKIENMFEEKFPDANFSNKEGWQTVSWYSGLGEDFFVEICATTPEDFVDDFAEEYNRFEPDDHCADIIQYRGKNGVPNLSIKRFVEDAEEIDKEFESIMDALYELRDKCCA